ncbi:hypothetical protein LY474_15890 [Myxococcus stipitatus]|uniref:hypothetical protein n=1 Tax=Myxococcus stipitatus TaxID=83455 RepID=UPI001F3E09C0|nr:hypothetical protein [Myxococcus stipitatus]MCE9669293.1 hypothetical protein [Myxococcus stipitatus]
MAPIGTRTRRGLGTALVAVAGLLAPGAWAEEPHVACTATVAGRRVIARAQALGFVSSELDRLVRLGMAGRLEVELTLWRRRSLWFDSQVDITRVTQVLAFSRGGYFLDGRPLGEGPEVLELERVAWALESRPEPGERFRVRVEVKLHVVTAASLGRMATWLTRKGDDDEETQERSTVTGTLLRSVAEDLSRRAAGRCDVTPQP